MRRMLREIGPVLGRLRPWIGIVLFAAAVGYVVAVVDLSAIHTAAAGLAAGPPALVAALTVYASAFVLRALAWRAVLPGLSMGAAWSGLHVALLGNHVLPFRLGEALRVTSVLRRTSLQARPVIASAVTLRLGDVVAVVALALLAAPALADALVGPLWTAIAGGVLLSASAVGLAWVRRLRLGGAAVRLPGPGVAALVVFSWLLESAIVWTVADAAGVSLSIPDAIGVTAVTMLAQAVAVTPAGVGSYEAAGTAALVVLGVAAGPAFAVIFLTHALKTAYALVIGGIALFLPAPGYFGRFRLPRRLPAMPTAAPVGVDAPVVVFIPAHNEEATVGAVVAQLPTQVGGRRVDVIVVDDGSTDATAERAARAGAHVVRVAANRGLGAAVRRGLAESVALEPACVVYLDADLEYAPADLPALAVPILERRADYVVGSRFAGRIEVMRAHRRFGNRVLTLWVRWMARRSDLTDGQSGYRAFSPAAAAAAEVIHDYNYAQVLTLDLLGKGFRYCEVPISYSFRTSGQSFIRLGRYLRRVVPAVHRELNAPAEAFGSPRG